MASLEGWGSTIELHPRDPLLDRGIAPVENGVGATGLEPAVFCSQSRRASHYATPRAFVDEVSKPDDLCPSSVWAAP